MKIAKVLPVCLLMFGLATQAYAKLSVIQKSTPFEGSYLFSPNDEKPHPGIVLLHGSEGGSLKNMQVHALLLVQSGFTVMTHCWWDCGRDVRSEPSAMLADIEVTDTVKAINWFRQSATVSKDSGVGVYGISKGAELAMVIAANEMKLPFKLSAVAIHSPNDVVERGSNINWLDSRCWVCKKGVNDCSYQQEFWNPSCGKIDGKFSPKDRDSLPMWRWNGARLKLDSRIEIENFSGSLLITAGDNDTDWLSDKYRVKRIASSLVKAGRKPQIHIFPGEKHSFGLEAEQKRKELVDKFFLQSLEKSDSKVSVRSAIPSSKAVK